VKNGIDGHGGGGVERLPGLDLWCGACSSDKSFDSSLGVNSRGRIGRGASNGLGIVNVRAEPIPSLFNRCGGKRGGVVNVWSGNAAPGCTCFNGMKE